LFEGGIVKTRFALLLLLLLTLPVALSAQDSPAPILLLINGADIWAAVNNNVAYPLTSTGFTSRPALSPTGMQVAYPVIDQIGIQALRVTGGLVSELPSNIVVHDLTSRVATTVASQPEGATFNAGEPAVAVVRSAPSWSPDGSAIAWTEDAAPQGTRSLVVYTLGGAAQTLASDLPLQAGFQQTLPVRWGRGGIALHSVTSADASDAQRFVDSFLIYSPQGALLASVPVQPVDGEYIYDFQWIDDNGVDKLGIIYSTGRWDLIDPASGTVAPLTGLPELYSLTAPDGISVVFGVTRLSSGNVFTWRVGSTPLAYTGPFEWLGISPAGNALAYAEQGWGYTWQDGTISDIYGTNDWNMVVSDVIWGPTGWRVAAP
jgi:hypothetical protein